MTQRTRVSTHYFIQLIIGILFRSPLVQGKGLVRSRSQISRNRFLGKPFFFPNSHVSSVTIFGAAKLPSSVVANAMHESKLSRSFSSHSAKRFVKLLNRWYTSQGYLASYVVEPLAPPPKSTGRLEVRVIEGKTAKKPININFYRTRWVNCTNNNKNIIKSARAIAVAEQSLLRGPLKRQSKAAPYREMVIQLLNPWSRECVISPQTLRELRSAGPSGLSQVDEKSFNGTHLRVYERVRGRTRPSIVAMALGIRPGSPLRLTPENIQRLRKRDIFQEIWFRGVKSVGDHKGVEMVTFNGKEPHIYPTKFVLLLDVIERDMQIFFEPSIKSNFAEKKVHGSVELKHENLFGLNQQVICRTSTFLCLKF